MNQWPTGQANGMFPHQTTPGHVNVASMYNNLGGPNSFDINQFAQTLANGNSGASTPAFPNHAFQPASLVPAKRPHDGMSGSPVQAQGSRSQTPSSYPGFPGQQQQQQPPPSFPNAPTPYSHLQQPGSGNATPSPTMPDQPFRPPGQQPQRMQNASPRPFPQQQGNFGSHMSPAASQNANLPTSTPQQNQMGGFNQQFGMSAGMPSAMPGQMGAMAQQNAQQNAQQQYKLKLMQHQQQLRASGMIPPRPVGGQQSPMFNAAGQQQMAGQMANGQANAQTSQQASQQAIQLKRRNFLTNLAGQAAQQGRQFNANPTINGRPVDLFNLWTLVAQFGGSSTVDRMGQWQNIANRLGFAQPQFPNAPEQLKQLYLVEIGNYERMWHAARTQQKQEQARMQAHQMAGSAGQASPPRTMQQPSAQQNQYSPFQQNQQGQPQPQATPVQPHAQLPQNGMSTPQQQQMLQHRRNSSVRQPEQMTPQTAGHALAAPSPLSAGKATQRPPSIIKQEMVMKSEEPQSTNYVPASHNVEWDGGYDMTALQIVEKMPPGVLSLPAAPLAHEMGVVDMKAITLSLASGLHTEVRYALDALVTLSKGDWWQIDLRRCDDLIDVLIDCAEEQVEMLSEEAAEVSDALDLPSYEDVHRATRVEENALQDVPEFGTLAYDLDRAADKLIAVCIILRNLTWYEFNHPQLTSAPLVKWLSNTIRLLGTRNMLLRTFYNTQDFYKDMIIFLSNVTQSLELPSRDDALHILHFLLAFAPHPAPSYTQRTGKITFTSISPALHRYLPAAVDCLAKLLARQDPNRMFYKSIFTASASSLAISESPLDLLTRAFALSVSVLPDRTRAGGNSTQLRIVEIRKAYMSQGMLAADILSSLAPAHDVDLARAWLESEDGWAVGLLNLAALLCVDRTPTPNANPLAPKGRDMGFDYESFKLITHRALSMLKRLADRAWKAGMVHAHASLTNGITNGDGGINGESDGEADQPTWEGVPQSHIIVGALAMPTADGVALSLLCGLHEMSMQS